MAFYPDELSPIDPIRNSDFTDLISKNRGRRKSLSLGKRDAAANNFATVTEEKEDEISNDGSGDFRRPSFSDQKITFPKPRKYVTSRLSDVSLKTSDDDAFLQQNLPFPEKISDGKTAHLQELTETEKNSKTNGIKEKRFLGPEEERKVPDNIFIKDRPKQGDNESPKMEGKPKCESEIKDDKRKNGGSFSVTETKKKGIESDGKTKSVGENEKKKETENGKKEKSLNVRDVVNVYRNLTYCSKEEIKSFVEKLDFVKGKNENDKILLSMMNLKALENKIRDLGKKGNKTKEKKEEKKGKGTNCTKKRNRVESLTRHKVVKVAATLGCESASLTDKKRVASRSLRSSYEKFPRKYVGTQSVLDKSYLVYPACPPSVNSKKGKKKEKKRESKANKSGGKPTRKKTTTEKKFCRSGKSTSRSSATTVCKVEFRPDLQGKINDKGFEETDSSLLVYLHGAKAINVDTPYSGKQFSRVKVFRKLGTRVPLIKGINKQMSNEERKDVSVKNIRLPEERSKSRILHLLDFEQDIENLNEFLRDRNGAKESEKDKKRRKTLNAGENNEIAKSEKTLNPETIMQEISEEVKNLEYLPDTEENRQVIARFFEELDQKIETTKARRFVENSARRYARMIPIMGF